MRAPAIIRAAGLGFTYGGSSRQVLRDVTFAVEEGEMALMIGPSGSGKSTLLRCLNGLVPHFHGGRFEGHVCVAGADTRERQPREMAHVVGMVFQDPEAQTVARTVEDEIAFGLENLGAPQTLVRKRLEEALDALGIAQLKGRFTNTLSGGELQRVAIASVLTMQPRVLLLDEPTSQLDPQAAEDLFSVLNSLRADAGLTIIVAEHRLERLIQYADRVMEVSGNGGVEMRDVRAAISEWPWPPPVSAIGRALGWSPLPLSVAEARKFAGRRQSTQPAGISPALSTGEAFVRLRGVAVNFDGFAALRGISLDIRQGEIIGLMGRNGAGKTTLLRVIAGLHTPDKGELDLSGVSRRQLYRDLAFLSQNPGSMVYKDRARKEIQDVLSGTGRQGSVDEALEEWRLQDVAERHPWDLSVGERQRLAIGAMLAGKPRLILLDEPTRGMDHETKELLVGNLRRRAREGATIILASHDVELAARLADRVVLLADGEVIADGQAAEVLSDSITFSTQANKLFGGGILTVEEGITAFRAAGERRSVDHGA